MNAIMGNFFGWLTRATWQAAVLAAIVIVVQLVFRKKLGARWRYALWLLVVARLVLPVSPHSALSLFNYAPTEQAYLKPAMNMVIAEPAPVAHLDRAQVASPALEPVADAPAAEAGAPEVYVSTSPAEVATSHNGASAAWVFLRNNFVTIGAVIWGIGAGLLALRVVIQNFAFVRRLRGARAVTESGTMALFEQCKESLGISFPVGLVETDQVKSPALHGYFRPTLLLPAQMIGGFSQKELRYIFLHELAHVKRQDMAVHWAATVLGILHWFNPVLWFSFRRMAVDRELACDEMALSHAGERENKPYGEAIIKVLELCEQSSPLPGVMGILESRDQMVQRVAMIVKFKQGSRRSLLALVLLVVLGLITLTDARSGPATETKPEAPASARPDLTGHIQTKDGSPLAATVFIYTAGPKVGTSTFCPSCYADCRKRATSDAKGNFKIESLDPQLIFRILVVAPGYAPKFVAKVDPAKGAMDVGLTPSDAAKAGPERSLHGRVVDAAGKPVEGAVVNSHGIHTAGGGGSWGSLPGVDPLAVTDAKGEFLITSREAFEAMDVKVEARAFANKTFSNLSSGKEQHDLALGEGAMVTGRVMLDGKPLKDISVGIVSVGRGMEDFTGNFDVATDAEGKFMFINVPPKVAYYLYGSMKSMKPYGALQMMTIHSGGDGETTAVGDLKPVPAYRLEGRVVLSDGKPVPAKTRLLVSREEAWDTMQLTLDENGHFDTTGIPPGEVSLSVHVPGYHLSPRNGSLDRMNPSMMAGHVERDTTGLVFLLETGKELQPDYNNMQGLVGDEPRDRPLRGSEGGNDETIHARDWALSGRVTDGDTGAAIAQFQLIPGNSDLTWNRTLWDALRTTDGTNGNFKVYLDKRWGQPALQVKAEGYLPASVSLTPMQTGKANVVLKKGTGPAGTVLLPDGKPAALVSVLLICKGDQNMSLNAKCELNAYYNRDRVKKTDADGHFSFAPELDMARVAAAGLEGFADVTVDSLKADPTIKLEAYGKITGKLTRASGPGKKEDLDVAFAGDAAAIQQRITLQRHAFTDEQGGFEFNQVPPGELQITYREAMNGQPMRSWQNKLLKEVTLKPGETLEIKIDAPDRKPDKDREAQLPKQPQAVRVEGVQLKGRVLLPNGKPATDAQVALSVEGKYLALGKATFHANGRDGEGLIVSTGPDGGFTLPMYDKATEVIALNDAGFAMVTAEKLKASPEIKLQAWGRIEGTLHVGRKLGTNQAITLTARAGGRGLLYNFNDFEARTDDQGRFAITYVPPGEQTLARLMPMGEGRSTHQPVGDVMVKAGGVTTVDLGGKGERVIGKVKLDASQKAVDWQHVEGAIHTDYPKAFGKMQELKTPEEKAAYQKTDEFKAVMKEAWKNFHSYPVKFLADGSFVAEEVPPGKYELNVQQFNGNGGQFGAAGMTMLGQRDIQVVASADKKTDAPIDLGMLELKPPKFPQQ